MRFRVSPMSWRTTLSTASLILALSHGLASAQAPGGAVPLPAGPGKELVEGICTACPQTCEIVRSMGYTKEGWKELIGTRIDLSKTEEQREQVVSLFLVARNVGIARHAEGIGRENLHAGIEAVQVGNDNLPQWHEAHGRVYGCPARAVGRHLEARKIDLA